MVDYSALTDNELQSLSLGGNLAASDALARRYSRLVKICIRPYFLAGGDNEDLLQEGMIGLLSAMQEYDSTQGTSFRTYAEICIKRRIMDAARSASRKKHTPLNDSVSLDALLFGEDQINFAVERSAEEFVLEKEQEKDYITKCSRFLSAFESQILSHYLDGESYAEIAEKLGRSTKSVDNAVQRIRSKLARHFHSGDFS